MKPMLALVATATAAATLATVLLVPGHAGDNTPTTDTLAASGASVATEVEAPPVTPEEYVAHDARLANQREQRTTYRHDDDRYQAHQRARHDAHRQAEQQAREAARRAAEQQAREAEEQAREVARREAEQQAREAEEQAREAARRETERIASFQQQLAALGWYSGEPDGEKDETTIRAVREFQTAAGLSADGIVGPNTKLALATDDAVTRKQAEARQAERQAAETAQRDTNNSSGSSSGQSSPPSRGQQVAALADSTGFDWRGRGVTLHTGCHPRWRCAWGLYDPNTREVWIGPDAFASQARLQYVVFHELAHAWQYSTGDMNARDNDLSAWGLSGKDGREAAADCVAAAWGATTHHYWPCPADARNHMASVYAAN